MLPDPLLLAMLQSIGVSIVKSTSHVNESWKCVLLMCWYVSIYNIRKLFLNVGRQLGCALSISLRFATTRVENISKLNCE